MTHGTSSEKKFLVLDGIGGIPLGREIAENLRANGYRATHFNCLGADTRTLYGIRSACIKAFNKHRDSDGFFLLPKLDPQTLDALVRQEAPTHILVIGFIYKFFAPRELQRIATIYGATLLLYDTDSCNLFGKRREFVFFIEHELPVYDRIFSFSQVTTNFFADTLGLNASFLPFAAAPIPSPDQPKQDIDALFVGSGDLRRILALEAIREQVVVYGNRWRRNFPLISSQLQERITDTPVWGNELHRLLARSKIVLNITRSDFFAAETGINLRIFEAVAAGCFLLTDYCAEIDDLFTVGHEIEVFHSSGELAEKVRYYLAHEEARENIARRGHDRYIREHTWLTRSRQLVEQLDFPPLPSPTRSSAQP